MHVCLWVCVCGGREVGLGWVGLGWVGWGWVGGQGREKEDARGEGGRMQGREGVKGILGWGLGLLRLCVIGLVVRSSPDHSHHILPEHSSAVYDGLACAVEKKRKTIQHSKREKSQNTTLLLRVRQRNNEIGLEPTSDARAIQLVPLSAHRRRQSSETLAPEKHRTTIATRRELIVWHHNT